MIGIIGVVLSWFTNSGISSIGDQLNRAWQAKLQAQNNTERLEADKTIATLNAQQAVIIAEQSSWLTRWIRPAFAFPFAVYNIKLILWDKVMGLGATDALSPELAYLEIVIIGAFFFNRNKDKRPL